jgi:hypothetical protein
MDKRRIRLLNEVSTGMVEAWSDLQTTVGRIEYRYHH